MYNISLKRKWDMAAALDDAVERGLKQGRKEAEEKARSEKFRSAFVLKKTGVSLDVIADSLGMSIKDIEDL